MTAVEAEYIIFLPEHPCEPVLKLEQWLPTVLQHGQRKTRSDKY